MRRRRAVGGGAMRTRVRKQVRAVFWAAVSTFRSVTMNKYLFLY